jgi:hypothetical protein
LIPAIGMLASTTQEEEEEEGADIMTRGHKH